LTKSQAVNKLEKIVNKNHHGQDCYQPTHSVLTASIDANGANDAKRCQKGANSIKQRKQRKQRQFLFNLLTPNPGLDTIKTYRKTYDEKAGEQALTTKLGGGLQRVPSTN
jgi:hypothetical protein